MRAIPFVVESSALSVVDDADHQDVGHAHQTQIGSSRKEFPVVAYNSKDDYYMVVWEHDFEGRACLKSPHH